MPHSNTQSIEITPKSLAQAIDHTLLKPGATDAELFKLCDEAKEYGFKTVCVEARFLAAATAQLAGSSVLPITVISFPEGNRTTSEKAAETRSAVAAGAREIDMVLNRELLKTRQYDAVEKDIAAVVEAAGSVPVKVILETSELTDCEKAIACALCKKAGAKFVKTSTGFSKSGATEADVRLMREVVGPEMGVKASGGIRSFEDAVKMIRAGASRLGTSASVSIVQGAKAGAGSY